MMPAPLLPDAMPRCHAAARHTLFMLSLYRYFATRLLPLSAATHAMLLPRDAGAACCHAITP